MKILVSWSIAYDYIMSFEDSFKNHILPEKIHILNVSFYSPKLIKEKWWTWHNIAYNLWLLWEKAILLWLAWNDFNEKSEIIDYSNLTKLNFFQTASCYLINDKDNNQINAFYPWAMWENIIPSIPDEEIWYAIISPNNTEIMISHLKTCHNLGIKTFFDPGQQIWVLTKQELIDSLDYTNYLIVNDYEFVSFLEKTGLNESYIKEKVEKIIVTLWKDWVKIIDKEKEQKIDANKDVKILDPTWAWDAFRAGLIYWLNCWNDWSEACRIWCTTASYAIEKYWTQNHNYKKDDIIKRYEENYNEKLNI